MAVELARIQVISDQEPFPTLTQELLVPLEDSDIDALERSLQACSELSLLQSTMYEFIETFVRNRPTSDYVWPYVNIAT